MSQIPERHLSKFLNIHHLIIGKYLHNSHVSCKMSLVECIWMEIKVAYWASLHDGFEQSFTYPHVSITYINETFQHVNRKCVNRVYPFTMIRQGWMDGWMDGWRRTDIDTTYTRSPMAGRSITCQLPLLLNDMHEIILSTIVDRTIQAFRFFK